MPVAYIMAQMYTMYAVYTMAAIMMITYSAASYAQQKSAAASARQQALQGYYNELAQGKTKSQAFASSKASSRSIKMQAIKYSNISEQLVGEAAAREKYSRSKDYNRSEPARLKAFGNKYAAKTKTLKTSGYTLKDLLSGGSFEEGATFVQKPDFLKSNFAVENFNTNYFEEV